MINLERVIKAPRSVAHAIIADVASKFSRHEIEYTLIDNQAYGIIKFISPEPYIIQTSVPVIERNASESLLLTALRGSIYASDLDLDGVLTYTVSGVTRSTAGDYEATIRITDRLGEYTEITADVTVADSLAPVITALDDTITYAEIAAWDNATMSAVDNTSDDVTGDVTITYFESDDTTPITDLAGFRTYLDDDGSGGVIGNVHYNLTDDAGNEATEVTITVTSEYKPVITATADTPTYAEIDAWDNDTMSATGVANEDVTGDVTIEYFESDGTTSIASLEAFRTYLDNSGSGDVVGNVTYSLTGADDVSITVTSGTPA